MAIKKRITRGVIIVTIFFFIVGATFHSDTGRYFEIAKNLEIFTNLYKEINSNYVDELEPSKIMRTGIDAMLESLDPYTNYFSESEMEGFRFMTEGRYNGIGARVESIDSYGTITLLYKDSPAHKAGLKVGDQITAINGKSTKDKNKDDLNLAFKGYPGTELELTIKRPGQKKEFTTKLVRGKVEVPNVPYYGMLKNNIGYISLSTFTRHAGSNIKKAFLELRKENPEMAAIILDLRGNGGGLLSEAVNISNIFIPKDKLIVNTRGKIKEWDKSFKTLNSPVDTIIPLAIMVNNRSASASEIVSGVIQDYDRGILVGQRTYGKGLVQNTRDVGYHSKVKMTTAKYYIPSNRCIQAVHYEDGEPVDVPDSERTKFKTANGRIVFDGGGLKPDIYIENTGKDNLLKAFKEQNIIFKYVHKFCLKNDSIESVENFHFTEWQDFVNYLSESNFEYQTESEKAMENVETLSLEEELSISEELNEIRLKIEDSKKDDLKNDKEEIIRLIEKEIAGRYYFQRGKTQIGLRNDSELEKAINVLTDSIRYNEILAVVK